MGAMSQIMADVTGHKVPTVRSRNHPPFGANKLKKLLCGDPVKAIVDRMKVYPDATDVQEESCRQLRMLAMGEYYNGLVGLYGGIPMVLQIITKFPNDSLLMYASVQALRIFAENGPNAEILRNAGAEKLVTDLRDNNPTDEYLRKDCEGFLLRLQETGVLLAKEYVENSVIEEDAAALLKYMQRYVDLEDVVEFGVSQIERFLVENEENVTRFVDGGDLTTFLRIIDLNKNRHDTMYNLFNVIYILAKNPGMSSELGKAGLLKASLTMIVEKKSGKHGELLQLLLFVVNRMCEIEANAILLHKLEGEAILGEIIEAIAEDQYEYPIAFPYKLKLVLRAREPLLKKDEEAKKMVFPERDDGLAEIARFRDESLVKALVLKRPGNVIAQKKGQEAWKGGGVVFDEKSGDTSGNAIVKRPPKKKGNKVIAEEVTLPVMGGTVVEIEHEGWDPSDATGPVKGGMDW